MSKISPCPVLGIVAFPVSMCALDHYVKQIFSLVWNRNPGVQGYLYTGLGVWPFLFAEGMIHKLLNFILIFISRLK